MKFRSKPSEVEAIQYGPEFRPGLVDEVASFIAGRTVSGSEVIEFVQPLAPWDPPDPEYSSIRIMAGKDGAQGWVPVPLGHWVVRSPGDLTDHWPVEDDYFSAKYQPLSTPEEA